MRRRWAALAALLAGVVLIGVAAGAVFAQTDTGSSSLGGFGLVARAPGFEASYDEPTAQAHPEGSGIVPHTQATLSTGPIGFAQSAVFWPGTLGGNLGDLLILASSGQVPENARALNDPYRAEARYPQGPSDATDDHIPGDTMVAHAAADAVQATGKVQQIQYIDTGSGNGASTGQVNADSKVHTDGGTGTADAHSVAHNVVIGTANVISIDSVESTATATTDGTTATGSGKTTVSGMRIGGQPATVDDQGVHFQNQGDPINDQLNQAAAAALSQGGFTILLSKPVGQPNGAAMTYNAGALVILWKPPNNPHNDSFTIVLGGASVSVNAGLGEDFTLSDDTLTSPPVDTGGTVGSVATPAVPGEVTGSVPATNAPARTTTRAAAPRRGRGSVTPISSTGVAPGWIVLGVFGAALAAAGLRRLTSDVLAETTTTACPLDRRDG